MVAKAKARIIQILNAFLQVLALFRLLNGREEKAHLSEW